MRAFLGLSSNGGDRIAHLQRAVRATPDLVAVSPVYETEPVGGAQQGALLSIVVELDTTLTPRRLLRVCRELERQALRIRRVGFGPHTLDVDIVWIDAVTITEDDLTIPPARMHERNFVIQPLLDLAPDLEVAGWDPATAFGEVEALGDLFELDLAPVAD
ncbi:MAG: 2-amino-4-hydroxy-6-hydroxymethyldihydropteridine diphosphokinase [Actinomycetia bacterium]|nr:2-amino-4-hydroxy-6-hydroxymethyldihydropteridine diphosphokinase [Actinomycetes bacterium]